MPLSKYTIVLVAAFFAGLLATTQPVPAKDLSCSFCRTAIAGQYYELADKRILCPSCHRTLKRCEACGAPFKRGEIVDGKSLCARCLASAERCSLCNTVLTGRFWTQEQSQKHFCDRCWNTVPRCSYCDTPTRTYTTVRDHTICPDCLKRIPECIHCREPVTTHYYRLEEGKLCEFCFKELPKCEVCGLPLVGAFRMLDEHKVCRPCHRKLPICTACDSKILGACWQFEDDDGTYCSRCRKDQKRCNVCSLPLDRAARLLADGRNVCSQCFKDGVFDLTVARRYLVEVKRMLRNQLDITVKTPARFSLVGQDKILALAERSPHLEKNRKDEFLGLFVRDGDNYHVYVEYGLIPPVLIGTLAHEYTHVWQEAHCPAGQSLMLREGFAEWVRYKIMEKKGFTHQMKYLEKRTDLYGKGFQLMRRIEKKRGVNGLFKYITSGTSVEEASSVRY
ncbi:MAG: hypothetical protein QGH40_06995 [bacterium]|nr:hypothetical protein [bacterium]